MEIYSLKQSLIKSEFTVKRYSDMLTKEKIEKDNCKIAFQRLIKEYC